MDPFAMALDALFASPMAVDAIYTPKAGEPVPARVIRSQPDQTSSFGDGRTVLATNSFEIRKAEASAPSHGDIFTLSGGETFSILGTPMLDVEGLTWSCPAEPA